jgi:hypothetical protein
MENSDSVDLARRRLGIGTRRRGDDAESKDDDGDCSSVPTTQRVWRRTYATKG